MRLWGYYAWHSFINTIKKMFRSTFVVVILAIVGMGVIFGVVGGIIGTVAEKQSAQESVDENYREDEEEEKEQEEKEEPMSAEDVAAMKTIVETVVALVFIVFLLWGLYSGSKKGTEIFLMADVNFLFTAPMKPQSVLMFRLTFQMATTILASVYLLFQIPKDAPEYPEAKRLMKFLDYFLNMPAESLPNNSICREFVGGSCFNV